MIDLWGVSCNILCIDMPCRHEQLSINLIQEVLLALCIACIFIVHFVTKVYIHPLYDLKFEIWNLGHLMSLLYPLTRHFHVVHDFFSGVQETKKQEKMEYFAPVNRI